jgi:hypothetical protein
MVWVLGYLTAARAASGEAGLPLDDAWIHARNARSHACGEGFTFNPGETSAASSAPLWTILLGVVACFGVPFTWAAYLPGIVLTGALAWLGSRVVRRATGDGLAAAAASFLLVSNHPAPWSAVFGMEPPLAAARVTATVLLSPRRRPWACLTLAAPGCLARPELLLLRPEESCLAFRRAERRKARGNRKAGTTSPAAR